MDEHIKLEPRDIRDSWDEIKPGLEELKAEWPELCTWRVEDVYAEVLRERAVLYMTEDGFAVCLIETEEFSRRRDLCIWIAYAYEMSRGGMLNKYLPSFIEVAKHLECDGVTALSNHAALAECTALKPVFTQYRMDVDG